jgi:hypothetical protein
MRDNLNLDGIPMSDENHAKLLRLFSAMSEYDATDDPIKQQRIVEEIRQLKKQLIPLLPQFKNTENMVAGDKDADKAELIVCADARPDSFRVKGTVEVPCSFCGVTVLLSPDSPKGPPKACYSCASDYAEKRTREGEEDSLGA